MPVVMLLLVAMVKASVLIGVAWLCVMGMRRASAAWRHAILLSAMIGGLLMPLLAVSLPTLTPASVVTTPLSNRPELQRWRDRAVALVMIRSEATSNLPVQSNVRDGVERSSILVLIVWLSGSAFVLVRIGADLVAAERSRRRARTRGRVGAGVPLLESADIGAPVVVGLLHPSIMVPMGTRVDAAEFQPMISHELAHIARRDCFTHLLVRGVCAFYWFSPLVWWTARRIALERERACDDYTLASGVDPIDYSQLLIDVARQNARVTRLHAATLMPQAVQLEKRIVCILDASTRRGAMSRWSIAALVIIVGTMVAPLAALGVRDRASFAEQLDLYLDPQSERVAGARAFDPDATVDTSGPDGALIAELRNAGAREPQSSFDLVPDRARWALSRVRDGKLVEPMIEALDDADWRVRGYAAWVLAVSGDPRAIEPLIPLLDHSVWRVRALAAVALGRSGDPRAAVAMEKALGDPAWQVRVEAVAYFGTLREPAFLDRIEPLRNDPHMAVRMAADEALNRIQ